MAKLPFAGVIPLTTTNRSRCLYRSTSFLCRFLLHILPQGFVRIRNFGFLANRRRKTLLPLAFSCWVQPKNRKLNNTLLPRKTRLVFGAVPSVVVP